MEYINLDPLYKLLCLVIIFLVPLVPAWALYQIAPSERFLGKGSFVGFKINATGASAIYIVLFVAIYAQTNTIINGIDSSKKLAETIQTLKRSKPWKVEYRLKLMEDSTTEINQNDYARYVHPDSIIFTPRAMHFDVDSKLISFYLDNDLLSQMGDTIKGQVLIRNGFGTTAVIITKACESPTDRTIKIRGVFYKARPVLTQIADLNKHKSIYDVNKNKIPVLGMADNVKPPPVVK